MVEPPRFVSALVNKAAFHALGALFLSWPSWVWISYGKLRKGSVADDQVMLNFLLYLVPVLDAAAAAVEFHLQGWPFASSCQDWWDCACSRRARGSRTPTSMRPTQTCSPLRGRAGSPDRGRWGRGRRGLYLKCKKLWVNGRGSDTRMGKMPHTYFYFSRNFDFPHYTK